MIKRFAKNLLLAVGVYAMFGSTFALLVTACGEDKDDEVVEAKKETTYTLRHIGTPYSSYKDVYVFEFDKKGYITARKYIAVLSKGNSVKYTAAANTTRIEAFFRIENKYYYSDGEGELWQEYDNNISLFPEEITESEYQRGISQ